MTTYVKIETFRRSTGPGNITNIRVVIPEGTNTTEALKNAIKEAAALTVDSDELIINDITITDSTVDLSSLLNIKYNAYLVKRETGILEKNESIKNVVAAKLTEKYPRQAAAYRANRANREQFKTRLKNNDK